LLQGILAILANLGSEGWQGSSVKLLDGYIVCLANKCMFEWLVWERHSLTIVILQLTHNSYQDKIQLDHALFCSSEHFLDFAFICLLVLTLGVSNVPVPMQVITGLATVKLRGCCRPSLPSLPSLPCKDWLEVGKDAKDHHNKEPQSDQNERAMQSAKHTKCKTA